MSYKKFSTYLSLSSHNSLQRWKTYDIYKAKGGERKFSILFEIKKQESLWELWKIYIANYKTMHEKIIVDVRSEKEFKQERIKDSIDIPLSFIENREERVAKLLVGKEVLLMCRTWRRAELAKQILSPHVEIEKLKIYKWWILRYKEKHPSEIISTPLGFSLPIMRQVQIVAWWLIVLFVLLALMAHQNFLYWALFVWSWLLFAGLSWTCMMATMLWKLPFNK